jgi:hypothetical protein
MEQLQLKERKKEVISAKAKVNDNYNLNLIKKGNM